MKRSPRQRRTAELSKSLQQKLNIYAIAASAAGVGLLALAQPAEARIVYTPAHERVPQNGSIDLDINHDGKTDFSLGEVYSCNTYAPYTLLWVGAVRSNAVVAIQSFYHNWFAAALRAGFRVSSNTAFRHFSTLYMAVGTDVGPWAGNKEAYLGLKFYIRGKIHYGWARVKVATQKGRCVIIKATLTGYAYESIPNKPIIAGKTNENSSAEPNPASLRAPASKPATLGALALGSPGLSIWKREESAVATR